MHNDLKHGHKVIKIAVSGAQETGHCGVDALDQAKSLGEAIARAGAVLLTGATTGFPLWVAMGAKEAGGMVIGFSPAASEREHVDIYKLPLDFTDLIVYTGFGYAGRDVLITRSADAVVCGCGRIGTIGSFTAAFESGKPLGIFEGPWETGNELKEIVEKSHRSHDKLVVGNNSKLMVDKLISLVQAEKVDEYKLTKNKTTR